MHISLGEAAGWLEREGLLRDSRAWAWDAGVRKGYKEESRGIAVLCLRIILLLGGHLTLEMSRSISGDFTERLEGSYGERISVKGLKRGF